MAKREPWLEAALESARLDLRHALRGLSHSPGFALVCVLLTALGVAASTTLFTLVERVLLRPLPFPEPERLVRLFETGPANGVARTGVARGNLKVWRDEATLFEGMAVGYAMGRTLNDEAGEAEVVLAAQVTCDFFPLLGVTPLHGRVFDADECQRAGYSNAAAPIGADPVVVLGHGLWRRRFAGDPAIVGRTLSIERRSFRVVGVLPADLELPEPGVQAFLAWELDGELPHDQRYTIAVGRMRRGATAASAEAELDAVAARLASERPESNRGWDVSVVPLQAEATRGARTALLVLLVASLLVLLIACANAALLFFARGQARAHEAALRLALGAARGRILRQGLLEAGVLAGLGGALGTGLAALAVSSMPLLWPDLPRLHELSLDGVALGFALLATLAAVLLAGGLPALRAAGSDPKSALDHGARMSAGRPAQGLRDALVVAEVAVTVVLLSGAGLLVRSVTSLREADAGFDPEGVLVAPIFLDAQQYDSGAKARAYYERVLERLRALPGVVAAGGATTLPSSPLGPDFARPVWPAGRQGDARDIEHAWIRMITPGYLEALSIPVAEGRGFEAADAPGAKPVVAVSETLARALWPGESAVGKSLVVDYSTAGTYPYEIVGVVADLRFRGPRSAPQAEVYFPHAQRSYLILNVAVRAAARAALPAAEIRRALREIDPQKPPHGVSSLSDLLGATYTLERRVMHLLVAFAVAACALSGLGLYGMLAYRVRQRIGEIGVRMALGAGRRQVVGFVLGAGARLLAAGILLGLASTVAAAPLLATLLHGVTPADLPTAVAVLGIVSMLGLVAMWLPARRAAGVDPAEVLRRG